MKLLCALLLFTGALLAQSVEGVVTSAADSQPLSGVKVQIERAGKATAETLSDGQGSFRFEGIQPGDYTASFSKSGFRQPERTAPARRPFHVAAGSAAIHLDARMTPLGKLSGRVLDANRRPMPHAGVQLLVSGDFTGELSKADDNGNFSFANIDPGIYTLSARAPKDAAPPPPSGDQRLGWVRTWYPSVADRFGGAKISIAPGAEVTGQDIELRAVPAHRLRGRLLDTRGEPASHVAVKIYPPEELITDGGENEANTAQDGSFEFPALYDGHWRLKAVVESGGVSLTAIAYQEMTGRDIERLDLRLQPPFTLAGKVVMETPTGAPPPRSVGIILGPSGGGDHVPHGMSNPDGTLLIEDVTPDTYRITPIRPGDPYYLASIQVGNREVLGENVEFSPGSLPITVTYKSDGGTVRGTVEDCAGATITLAPQKTKLLIGEFIQRAVCDAGGRFQIGNIRPGEYYSYAFDRAPGILEYSRLANPTVANQAVRVTVRAGESSSITLKVTSLSRY
jgi:hypothetical protein